MLLIDYWFLKVHKTHVPSVADWHMNILFIYMAYLYMDIRRLKRSTFCTFGKIYSTKLIRCNRDKKYKSVCPSFRLFRLEVPKQKHWVDFNTLSAKDNRFF